MDFSFDAFLKTAPPTLLLRCEGSDYTIITANPAYLRITGTLPDELSGRKLSDAFPNRNPQSESVRSLSQTVDECIRTKMHQVTPSQKFDIPVRDTQRFNTRYWRATVAPIIGNEDMVEYVALSILDITDTVAAVMKERFVFAVAEERRKATQQMEERLRLAIDSADMGTWTMNVETREFTASPRMKAMFGFGQDEKMTYNALLAQIQPEFREKVASDVEAAIAGLGQFNIEYPITELHDQKPRWLKSTGKLYEGVAGKAADFSGTTMDITEKKLEEIRKNDFLSIASHELKTPLTSLKASLQLLTRVTHEPGSEMLPKLIDLCNKSMDKISSLVNDLLNAGRITNGKIELKQSVFLVSDLVDKCCDHLKSAGTHEVVVEGETDLQLLADHERVDQVLVNLVNNAVKYAAASFRIIIRSERLGSFAKISVQDFGPGIAEAHLEHLFKRYYRVDSNRDQTSGLGLGLYISAEIIRQHGGQMGVNSDLGKGSTFWFTLPLVVS